MHSLISLGANLGNPRENVESALRFLREAFGKKAVRESSIFETAPVGGPSDQNPFLNLVVAVESALSPFEVWHRVRQIEQMLGRQRQIRWEARRIDVDVLLCGEQRIWTPRFKVPHPRMCMRSFILEPASEIASDWVEPVSGCSIGDLANRCREEWCHLSILAESEALEIGLRRGLEEVLRIHSTLQQSHWVLTDEKYRTRFVFLPPLVAIDRPNPREIARAIDRSIPRDDSDSSLTQRGLLIGAVSSPDPNTVAWEDHCRPWAEHFGMIEGGFEGASVPWNGPRYLLASNDIQWAIHEIVAAAEAMRCSLRRID